MIDLTHHWNKRMGPLVIGFILSLALVLIAYFVRCPLVIFGLGTLLSLVQLVFFMNLGIESKPRWNLLAFFFMLIVIVVLVGGSMWIMHHLNYNMMLPNMQM